jgi:hypothetical protein
LGNEAAEDCAFNITRSDKVLGTRVGVLVVALVFF